MRRTLLPLLLLCSLLSAQEEKPFVRSKIMVQYGVSLVDPRQINDRIAMTNQVLGSNAKTIKNLPELSATVVFRPQNDFKIVLVRAGYATVERLFDVSLPWTDAAGGVLGSIDGTITETYTVYPFSLGVGMMSDDGASQFQLELCYALAEIGEEGSYRTDRSMSYSHTLTSEAYSIRVAGSVAVPVTPWLGVTVELGYRYLLFDEFEDEKGATAPWVEMPLHGVNGSVGLSLML